MSFANRAAIVDFIEHDYFGSAVRNDVPAMLACFEEQAEVLVRHGDYPVRFFSPSPSGKWVDLKAFYTHLCGTFEPWFGGFCHFVDLAENRSACYFTVRLTPRSPEMLAEIGVQELKNCNFFEYSGQKIQHMIIYYANADARAGVDAPTGYPR